MLSREFGENLSNRLQKIKSKRLQNKATQLKTVKICESTFEVARKKYNEQVNGESTERMRKLSRNI